MLSSKQTSVYFTRCLTRVGETGASWPALFSLIWRHLKSIFFQKLFFVCQIICAYFFVCLTCYCVRNCLVLVVHFAATSSVAPHIRTFAYPYISCHYKSRTYDNRRPPCCTFYVNFSTVV